MNIIFLILSILVHYIFTGPVLRYNLNFEIIEIVLSYIRYRLDSCNSLEPLYVQESWAYPGGGNNGWDGGGEGLFESPRRSGDRSPPFSIQIDFNQYRRNREYTG